MNKRDRIIEVIRSMDESDLIAVHNAHCEDCNNMDDQIMPNTEDTMQELFGEDSPWNIACRIQFGDWNPSHDYMWFNGYANVESGDGYMLIDRQIFPGDIANDAIRNDNDYGSEEIREILDDEEM